jgi:hypothetical protein
MKLKVIIITLFVVVFLTSCTSPDGGWTRDYANDVRLINKGMHADSMYSDLGYNTNYGLAAITYVALKPAIKDFLKPSNTVNFWDVDWLNEKHKDEKISVVLNSNDLKLVKDDLNEYFMRNGFMFNHYNKYRGNFHKKVGEKYPRIIVDVFPQPNNTIKLAIDKRILDIHRKNHLHSFSSEFAKDTLDGFKKEFEEGSI